MSIVISMRIPEELKEKLWRKDWWWAKTLHLVALSILDLARY